MVAIKTCTVGTSGPLQDIVIVTILGGKNSVQGPLLLKLVFVGLKTMSLYVH